MDVDLNFDLNRLFDPYNLDHIPEENRLDFFVKRDLQFAKKYKALIYITGARPRRVRTHYAHTIGVPKFPCITPSVSGVKQSSKLTSREALTEKRKKWIAERKQSLHFRDDDKSVDKFLGSKPFKTAMELRYICNHASKSKTDYREDEVLPERAVASRTCVVPSLHVPSINAVRIISKHLRKYKYRTMDLCADLESKGNWNISLEDLKRRLSLVNINLKEDDIREVIAVFGVNDGRFVDFLKFCRALISLQKVDLMQCDKNDSVMINSLKEEFPETESLTPSQSISNEVVPGSVWETDKTAAIFAGYQTPVPQIACQESDSFPPPLTGDDRIDPHCQPSSLPSEVTADILKRFRKARLREYYACVELCRDKGVIFTPLLLKKALLYPGDRNLKLASRNQFAGGGGRRGSGSQGAKDKSGKYKSRSHYGVKHSGRDDRYSYSDDDDDDDGDSGDEDSDTSSSSSGRRRKSCGMVYPFGRLAASKSTPMNLSTGRKKVKRKLDCWMTFEEYERMTGCYEIKYLSDATCGYRPFWPGDMLNKLRLCMPPYDQPPVYGEGGNAIFHHVPKFKSRQPQYENICSWPLGPDCFVQKGYIDKAYVKHRLLH